MAYVPDPTDVSQPTDAISAETAQAEFRALKVYIAGIVSGGVAGMNIFRKNKIINGDMRIDQRNAGAAVSTNAKYGVDRWLFIQSGAITGSVQQKTGDGPAGFTYYNRISTTSNAAPAAGEYIAVRSAVEGYDCEDLLLGTANATKLSISGFFRSTKAGKYPVAIVNFDNSRSYAGTITIAAANTWEYHQVNLTGDTAGVWKVDNSIGLQLFFAPCVGTTFQQAENVWSAGNFFGATGQQQNSANTDTFDFTGIQLERSDVATAFERRHFTEELLLCKRYFNKSFPLSTAPAQNASRVGAFEIVASGTTLQTSMQYTWRFPVDMRITPTVVTYNPAAANSSWRDANTSTDVASVVLNICPSGCVITNNSPCTDANIMSIQATADAEP